MFFPIQTVSHHQKQQDSPDVAGGTSDRGGIVLGGTVLGGIVLGGMV